MGHKHSKGITNVPVSVISRQLPIRKGTCRVGCGGDTGITEEGSRQFREVVPECFMHETLPLSVL